MASLMPADKTIATCHYSESHTTTKHTNTLKNQKIISILHRNGVEAYEIKIY